jgi:hypothetical protein
MPKGAAEAKDVGSLVALIKAKTSAELARVQGGLNEAEIERLTRDEFARLENAVKKDDPIWLSDLPGRPILNKFASLAGLQPGRLKQLFLANAEPDKHFGEIISIFESFRSA